MRVLHIGKFFPPFAGGIEHFLADLLPMLQQQGTHVATLVHDHSNQSFVGNFSQSNFHYDSAPIIYRVPCYGQIIYAPISPTFPFWLKRAVREFKPDMLHLHMPNTSAFWAILIPSARRIPWIVHWHSDVVPSKLNRRLALAYRFYRPVERRLLAMSRAIIATSPPYRESSEALEPWLAKCHVIPLGLNPARLPKPDRDVLAHTEREWSRGTVRILAVGRLTYYKGFETLIRAIARTSNLQLVIVGTGEDQPRLQTLIKTLKLEARVTLSGFAKESRLHALFATCDIFCLPSLERTEAFGIVLLEAMHFRKPVIASDITGSGVGWLVREGKNGMLVPPGNIEQLASALQQLAENPAQRDYLGSTGNKRLETLFHIKQVAAQINALYKKIGSTSNPKSIL